MKKNILLIITVFLLVITTACGSKKTERKEATKKQKKYDYLVLVNKYSKLPDDWEKNIELVNTKNAWDEDIQVEKQAFENYKKLKKELENDGVTIELDSVYRSVKEQQQLWDDWSKDPEKGIEYVKKYVAVPGYSEHHTGLAIDICLKKDGKLVYENDDMIADRETFAKIHKKLAKYGFILRYLEGRDETTGYAYEPWHLRYVGSAAIAKEITNKNITLEEYLGSFENIKSNHEAAKYKIEKTLQEYLVKAYDEKIDNIRFNVTKIYTEKEEKEEPIKSLELGKNEVAFEVEYQLLPKKEEYIKDLTVVDGEYDEQLGWVKNIARIGTLRFDEKTGNYSIKNFGTGF